MNIQALQEQPPKYIYEHTWTGRYIRHEIVSFTFFEGYFIANLTNVGLLTFKNTSRVVKGNSSFYLNVRIIIHNNQHETARSQIQELKSQIARLEEKLAQAESLLQFDDQLLQWYADEKECNKQYKLEQERTKNQM